MIASSTPDCKNTAGMITGPVPNSPLKRENNPPKNAFQFLFSPFEWLAPIMYPIDELPANFNVLNDARWRYNFCAEDKILDDAYLFKWDKETISCG